MMKNLWRSFFVAWLAVMMIFFVVNLSGCELLKPSVSTSFLLSGGVFPSDSLVVDDDICLWVDGEAVFLDTDGFWTGDASGTYKGAPIEFAAAVTSILRIEVADTCCCQALVGPLHIHRDDGYFALLTNGVRAQSRGSCGGGVHDPSCFHVFFDEEFHLGSLEFVPALQKVQVQIFDAGDDGDTVDFSPSVVGKTRVRYTGIDTPEIAVGEEKPAECLANGATERNQQLTEGKEVWLELDERTVDNIGRLLAYVHTAPDLTLDSMVNYRLLLEGYAKIYKVEENWRYVDEFRNAQIEAVANRRGMWSECGGYADADIVIAAIQFWSSDEFVVILNRGAQAVNLDGWTISDEHGNSYVFQGTSDIPAWSSTNNFTESIRTVHSGSGTNQEIGNDLQWTNSYIWNETGDTAYLRNPAGDVICSYDHKGF
jgi:endonuclease YncB( thermonuclease family)